ncbi:MAG: hypothetical protein MSC31_10865 [Solirubrobacteraceae bacterium MAG38_C4-C5]|nr:hypothetical protein [Candidatus Siliceabacter maunaloa]
MLGDEQQAGVRRALQRVRNAADHRGVALDNLERKSEELCSAIRVALEVGVPADDLELIRFVIAEDVEQVGRRELTTDQQREVAAEQARQQRVRADQQAERERAAAQQAARAQRATARRGEQPAAPERGGADQHPPLLRQLADRARAPHQAA